MATQKVSSHAHDSSAADGNLLEADADGFPSDSGIASDDVVKRDGSVAMTGDFNLGSHDITNAGNVDGRDVSVDGTKLDGIEAGADVTANHAPQAHASSHENGGSDEISVAGLSGELADAQPPKAHNLGGAEHNADTLANLNAKISDATLDDASDSRTPTAHASSHQNGGSDEISVTGLSGLLADAQTPTAHASSHENGGSDEISLAGLSGEPATLTTHKSSGDHDSRYYTESEVDTALSGKADTSHNHSGSDITSGTVAEARIDSALMRDSEHAADAHTMTIDGRDVSVDGAKLDGIESGAEVNDLSVVASGDNESITTYKSITGLSTNKHYHLYWSGWLDNGGNSTDNKFYLRFNNDSTAGHYKGYRRAQGTAGISDWSDTSRIEFARTAYSKDTYFDFTINIFTGDAGSYFATGLIKAAGVTWDNASDNRLYVWDSGGVILDTVAASISSIQFGISVTGAGYSATSWYRLVEVI